LKIEKLVEVNLRDLWKHEATDFTKWLAQTENIVLLGNEIGLTLTDIQTEHCVGRFSCDMICKDEITQKLVIVENQLESTDHIHLGQIITYAGGLNASYIIWIVKDALPEHASAIEWLNNHTDEDISFFLIEIKAWKIGDSNPAPQFNIIEQPNDFNKNVKRTASRDMSDAEKGRLEFWENFNKVMKQRKVFNVRTASTNNWYNFAIGSSLCRLGAELVNKEGRIRVGFWIDNDKKLFDFVFEKKEEIENKLTGLELSWFKEDGKKMSGVSTNITGLNFKNNANYDALANEIIDVVVLFRNVFQPVIKIFLQKE